MKQPFYIARRMAIAVLLLLLLALAPARAQTVVYLGETTELGVEQKSGDTFEWELYSDSTVNFAQAPGDSPASYADFVGGNTGPTVNVNWKAPGNYFFKVTSRDVTGCTSNLKMGRVKVINATPTATITAPDPKGICVGEAASIELILTGTGPWDLTYTDGISTWSVNNILTNTYTLIIDPGPTLTTDYRIDSISDIHGTNTVGSNTVTQRVNPLPSPSAILHN